jgi:enoyl-CoA hydratase/carnithine racemase
MYKAAMRRLQANFCYFNNSKKSFTENLKKQGEKKPFESVLYKQHNKDVLEIILNEPKKLNSLDTKMIRSMLRKVKQFLPEKLTASSDEEATDNERVGDLKAIEIPKVIIMSGAGGKSFCAGGDISSLYHLKKNGADDKVIKDFFRYEYLLDYLLTRMRPIHIAMWNGYVMGGGVGISINAPIRIATDNTMFAMPGKNLIIFRDSYWIFP